MSGGTFVPHQLFASGAQGAWYDPSDFSTLFQDAAGTTPVTAVEQPVRLMLDRSRGLVLGSELVTNGGFDTDTAWTKGTGWTISGGQLVAAGANGTAGSQTISLADGVAYLITVDVLSVTAGSVLVRLSGSTPVAAPTITAPGSYTFVLVANSGTTGVHSFGQASFEGTLDNISVRELPGAHALAPNDASRPVLRARYNLLTRSEEFDNGAWSVNAGSVTANAAVAPDGTTTADLLTADGTPSTHFIRPASGLWTTGNTFTETVYIKRNTANFAYLLLEGHNAYIEFSLTDGSVTFTSAGTATNTAFQVTDAGDGWYRVRLTATNTTGATMRVRYYVLNASSNVVSPNETTTASMYLWGAQLLTAADAAATGNAYQRIAAATDYDVSNPVWRPYLAFDGSDDSFSTSAIDFSGTDEMTVFAGVHKASDAAVGLVAELSTDALSNPGFYLAAPLGTGAGGNFGFFSSGSVAPGTAAVSSTILAPVTRVLTGQSDISTDTMTLRVNGTAVSNTSDQGTGNYANAALFIGRRNNTNFPFNGRLYSLAVLGRTATAPELSAMEAWVAGKTGVTI